MRFMREWVWRGKISSFDILWKKSASPSLSFIAFINYIYYIYYILQCRLQCSATRALTNCCWAPQWCCHPSSGVSICCGCQCPWDATPEHTISDKLGSVSPDAGKANYFSCSILLMWLPCFLLQSRLQSSLRWITYLAETNRRSTGMFVRKETQSDSIRCVFRKNPDTVL